MSAAQKPPIVMVLVFENFNVACTDAQGAQIPELQTSLLRLWAEHAERIGYNLHGVVIETARSNWNIERGPEGLIFRPA